MLSNNLLKLLLKARHANDENIYVSLHKPNLLRRSRIHGNRTEQKLKKIIVDSFIVNFAELTQ